MTRKQKKQLYRILRRQFFLFWHCFYRFPNWYAGRISDLLRGYRLDIVERLQNILHGQVFDEIF